MLDVEGLRKTYGAVTAVEDVSFAAADGRITGLLGANGAGKTTTLGMIAGVTRPDAGAVRLDGTPLPQAERRRRIGALHDHKGLYARLTARENIRYFGALHGLAGPDLERRLQRVLALLDLGAVAGRPVAGFSQGERMKVALARALVHDPGTLLLDEPTNGLDVPAVRAFRALLMDLRAQGACIVFSSHVLEDVSALCDTVVVIARGRVVASGEPRDLCQRAGCVSLDEAFMRLTSAAEESRCVPRA